MQKRHTLKTLAALSTLSALGAVSPRLLAQAKPNWPTRTVKLLVGFPAGSSPDLMARALVDPLAKALGQAVIVETRVGASGNIAADALAKANDDHTIGLMSVVNLTTAKMLNAKLPYDPSDFTPLTMVGTAPLVLVANNQVAANGAAAFLRDAKAGGASWNYGSPGNGTVGHIGMELVKLKAGLQAQHIPYPGVPQLLTAMIAGQIQMALIPLGQALPQLRAGRIKAIGSSVAGVSPLAPELPTLASVGLSGIDLDVWNAMAAPKSMPKPIADYVAKTLQGIIRSAETRQTLFNQGWQAMGTSPEALNNKIVATKKVLGEVIAAANIKVD